jgi:hypothetical protein
MRQLILLFSFLISGCLNRDPASYTAEELQELENVNDDAPIYTPNPTLEYQETPYDAPPLMSYEPCICVYYSWRDRDLICVGLVCTDSCSLETRTCNERRRACVPEFP